MQRRTFMQLIAGASAGTVGAAVGLGLREDTPLLAEPAPGPLFPGLPVSLRLRPEVTRPCDVAVVWEDDAGRTLGGVLQVRPGEPTAAPLPWPWDTLKPGTWDVHVVATDGEQVHRLLLGTCRVRSPRFGA